MGIKIEKGQVWIGRELPKNDKGLPDESLRSRYTVLGAMRTGTGTGQPLFRVMRDGHPGEFVKAWEELFRECTPPDGFWLAGPGETN